MNVDTASPWEIDPKIGQLPFICTLSISFQVVRNDIGGGPNSSVNTTDEKPTTTKQNEQEKVSLKNLSNMDPNKEQFSLKNLSEKNPKKEKFSL